MPLADTLGRELGALVPLQPLPASCCGPISSPALGTSGILKREAVRHEVACDE
jgi:hypothetical protein